ncbi:hypothetical protein VP01_1407g4 [Puccinia sorghi]|uniref:Uncharacterized protein n=1 Tax=Puccinia sorghi TaxID=27349 RepID=A0A0L6VMR0_9BASI|nr:hypothetical protein VP01_1407g4 [Puccinia sorghi]
MNNGGSILVHFCQAFQPRSCISFFFLQTVELLALFAVLVLLGALADPRTSSILLLLDIKTPAPNRPNESRSLRDEMCYEVLRPFLTRYGYKPIDGFCESYTAYTVIFLLLLCIAKLWNPLISWLDQEWESFRHAILSDR